MPFPEDAKAHLGMTLAMANVFTDREGQYPSLPPLIDAIEQLQRFIGWQMHHLYTSAKPGRNPAKKALLGYISLESSVDLFMRFTNIPPCTVYDNLAYLDENVQKLIYGLFKQKLLRESLYKPRQFSLKVIETQVKAIVKEKVQGYATRPSKQKTEDRIFPSDEEWEIFVAEVNVGISRLCNLYNEIISQFHREFASFRQGQLRFILNFFDRCYFLTQVESWLNRAPNDRGHPPIENEKITAFCAGLKVLAEKRFLDHDLHELNSTLELFKTCSLSIVQYKNLVQSLIEAKPTYDLYCTGQDKLSLEDLLKSFMNAWPKPQLPHYTSREREEVDRNWTELRAKHRQRQEDETDTRERKVPAPRPAA